MFKSKNLKRIMSLLVVTAFALSACSAKDETTTATTTTTASAETTTTAGEATTAATDDTTTAAETTTAGEETTAAATGDKKKIVYGGWEGKLMANELAEKFEAENPDIDVEIFNNGEWLGNDQMSKLVSAGSMPDIINLQDVVVPTQNKWVIDLKPYMDKYTDSNLPSNFIKYGTVNDKVIMIPSAVFLWGVIVNLDLLSSNNIEAPEYGWTIDQYVDIAKKTTKKGSTIGLTENGNVMKHLPPQMNDELGWGCFNEVTKKYQLGDEWLTAVSIVDDIIKSKISINEQLDDVAKPWLTTDETEKKALEDKRAAFLQELIGETDSWIAWQKGKVALVPEFSWNMNFDKGNANYGGFEWDFYPFPVKDAGDVSRPGIVVDSIGVTSNCKYPEEAFRFAKYLSYDVKGFNDRVDIVKNYDKDALMAKYPDFASTLFDSPLTFSQLPAIDDPNVIATWTELNGAKPGIQFMMEHMSTGYADGFKVTPGFDAAYHKAIEDVVRAEVFTGKKSAADLAKQLEEQANKITQEAYDALK